jgi:hypothetical protein
MDTRACTRETLTSSCEQRFAFSATFALDTRRVSRLVFVHTLAVTAEHIQSGDSASVIYPIGGTASDQVSIVPYAICLVQLCRAVRCGAVRCCAVLCCAVL